MCYYVDEAFNCKSLHVCKNLLPIAPHELLVSDPHSHKYKIDMKPKRVMGYDLLNKVRFYAHCVLTQT